MIVIPNGDEELVTLVVEQLIKHLQPSSIRVTVSSSETSSRLQRLGVDIAFEDFRDVEKAAETFASASQVLSCPPPGWQGGGRITEAHNLIKAAVMAEVPHIVHVGIINNDHTHLKWQHALDGQVRRDARSFTVLRRNLHTEELLPAVICSLQSGTFFGSFGGNTLAPAAHADYAEAVARVLIEEDHKNKIYELSGFGLTGLGFASVASLLAEREIAYREVALDDIVYLLVESGAQSNVAENFHTLCVAVRAGEFSPSTDTLDELLGRPHLLNEEALRRAMTA